MSYLDTPAFKESYEQWFYNRKGFKLKDHEFTLGLLEEAYEREIPLGQLTSKRAKHVADFYMNNYLPNTWYGVLGQIPTAAQAASLRAAPIGFLKDTVVERGLLKPRAKSTLRNNYKAVADATEGLTIDDLEKIIEEFTEFTDMSDGNLAIYGTRATIAKARATIAADVNIDKFNKTGKPTSVILGVQFIENDMIAA